MNEYDIIKSSEAVHGVGVVIWLQEPIVTSPVTSGGQCGGNCNGLIVRLGSSAVRVLTQ